MEDEKNRLKSFMQRKNHNQDTDSSDISLQETEMGLLSPGHPSSKPIAELFTDTTIMFADLAGFTAWSSEREPCQVFQLLETVYQAFDEISNKLGIFKVETIGDCYGE